jgi:glutamate carboxypeptidase
MSEQRRRLETFLEARMPEAMGLLRKMVGINSFTANPQGVNELSQFTAAAFADLGFTAEFVAARNPDYGKHLVLSKSGTGSKTIAFVSHLDTVFPPEEELRNDFAWREEGDRIYGPGTQDIKGGTVMMWLVLHALRFNNPELFHRIHWRLFLNAAEERFSPDFGDLCRRVLNPAETLAALVFEAEGRMGNEHLLVLARKGRATWRITSSGRAAHAGGKHSAGANAIVQLGITLQKVAALTEYSKHLTVNVATISGGTVHNRVPHEAVAEGEMRAFLPAVYNEAKARLLGLAGPGEIASPADKFPCQLRVEILTESTPWPRNRATDDLFAFWEKAGSGLGIPAAGEERGGLSDGNLIWDSFPTLDGLGPWGDNDHCSERSADGSKVPEYVDRSTFVPKALLNTFALCELIQARG